jgi:uncharacterized membrane protein
MINLQVLSRRATPFRISVLHAQLFWVETSENRKLLETKGVEFVTHLMASFFIFLIDYSYILTQIMEQSWRHSETSICQEKN